MKAGRIRIFISHATADQNLAGLLQRVIVKSLKLPSNQVFCSSDNESMKLGKKDEPQLAEAHSQAKAVVALMTPKSIFRPWVIYEAGGADFSASKPLFVVLANGITVDCLPAPIKSWHAGYLENLSDISRLCESLGGMLNLQVQKKCQADQVQKKCQADQVQKKCQADINAL